MKYVKFIKVYTISQNKKTQIFQVLLTENLTKFFKGSEKII